MARGLATILLGAILCASGLNMIPLGARAAELDAAAEAEAKEATRLYKQGMYEEAAKRYAKLSVDYPDMPIFERNMGACYYYLKRPEPALSNLRNYLLHKKNIAPDDQAVVERWIAEMEKLRAQPEAAANAPPVTEPVAPAPAEPSFPAAPATMPPPAPSAPPLTTTPSPEPAPTPAPVTATPAPPAAPPAALDLTAQPASSHSAAPGSPFYKSGWFWGAVGVIVVAGATTAVLLSRQSASSNIPATVFGNQEAFQ